MTDFPQHVRVPKEFPDPSRTHQSFKDSADINTIMERWRTTGFVRQVNLNRAVYEDFSTAEDYFSCQTSLLKAQAIFDSLPARVRDRVNNEPAELIAFVEDPANDAELRDLGLKNPILEEGQQAPPVTHDPPSSAPDTPGGTGEDPGECP